MASQLNMWNLRKTTMDAHKTVNLQKCDNIDKNAATFQDCNCMRKNATTSAKIQHHRQKCKCIGQKCNYIFQKCKYIVQQCNNMGKMRSDKLLQEWGTWGVAQWTRRVSISPDVDGSLWAILKPPQTSKAPPLTRCHRHQKIFILMIVPPRHLRSLLRLLRLLFVLRVKMRQTGAHYCKMWRRLNLE